MQEMPDQMEMPALKNLPAADDQAGGEDPAMPLDTFEAVQQNLTAFIDNMHSKASQVIMWVNNVEPLNTDRSRKCPVKI